MKNDLEIRTATPDDAAIIARHRRLMFDEMDIFDPAGLDAMDAVFPAWVKDKLEQGEYRGWFITDGERIVAGAGVWIREWIPKPNDLSGKQGHIVNVYTHPDYRRMGLARRLMEHLLAWCAENGVGSVDLNASDFARKLYLSLGFESEGGLMSKRIE